jgi:dye decolorizing peroxidase
MTEQSRRLFLASSASVAAGAIAGSLVGSNLPLSQPISTDLLAERIPFNGPHQAGIELEQQSHSAFIAFDLLPGTTKEACLRWMGIITEDAVRLTDGLPTQGDPQPELVLGPAGLTVTVGYGPELFDKLNLESQRPASLVPLPAFSIDQLRPEFTGGDVLIHVSAHDPVVLSHAFRQFLRTSKSFANLRWVQQGFLGGKDDSLETPRPRNLMGQVEGSGNPEIGTDDFAKTVWVQEGPSWLQGGTLLVLRRIKMNLDSWDQLGRSAKEKVIGRTLANSAPLGSTSEKTSTSFSSTGDSLIPYDAHFRRASPALPGERIFRRSFNFQTDMNSEGVQEVGLIWAAYQNDISKQYLPIQRRLESLDALNSWTTPIGSAVFAIARGAQSGEVIGQELFS